MPFGQHKGFGLAIMCELLAATLVGNATIQPDNPRPRAVINNMMMFAVDPQLFGGTEHFQRELQLFINYVKSTPTAIGHDEVLMAGEPEQRSMELPREN